MTFLQKLNNSIEIKGTQPSGTLTVNQSLPLPDFMEGKIIGNEMVLYAAKNGENLIAKGYNINSIVYTCISIISKMFGKVPFYVVDIKANEKKTWEEYKSMRNLQDVRAIAEMKRMRKKSIDGIILDTKLSKFLAKPNRNQSGVKYREQLIAYKKTTGEGNSWFNRGVDPDTKKQRTDQPPFEMFNIPKFVLQLVGNQVDPWEIVKYQMNFPGGRVVETPKENILMWIEESLQMDNFLNHLRGMSPLEAVLLQIQALNESAEREIKEAVNGGAYGLLYRKDANANQKPDPGVASFIREQINNAVNGKDVAGAIAWLAGEWGYLPFGRTSQELQRLELTEKNKDDICNVLGVPPGLLKTNQTYENAKMYWKQLIYRVIAPEAYSLRDAWNGTLIEMFGMDPERQQIDCDVMALPELSQDLKEQVEAVKGADWLTLDEKRIATGYEPLGTPEAEKVYVSSSLQSLDQLNADMGAGLDNDLNLLNEDV